MTAAEESGVTRQVAGGASDDSLLDPDGRLRALADDCVHCGFCLPACPDRKSTRLNSSHRR